MFAKNKAVVQILHIPHLIQILTFQYLDGDENSLWSLLLSVGYIKAENVVHKVDAIECDVSVTNKEVMAMFRTEILGMFRNGFSVYNRFVKALLEHNIEDMNDYLSEIDHGLYISFCLPKIKPSYKSFTSRILSKF